LGAKKLCLGGLFLEIFLFFLFYNISTNSKPIAHNVPAVYDVFAVAIKETAGFQQPQKCGWSVAWE
jgi:hypothetical protein